MATLAVLSGSLWWPACQTADPGLGWTVGTLEGRVLVRWWTPTSRGAATAPGSGSVFSGRRNSPEWVRVTGEWLAQQRDTTPDSISEGLVAAYDATFRGHPTN